MTFNTFDIVVLTILLLSSLLAMFRGLLREILSLSAWVGAAIITSYSYSAVGEALRSHVNHEMAAKAGGAVATFVAALIVLSIINVMILKAAKKADIGPLDRTLGLAFGIMRGLFFVSLGYMVFSVVMARQEKPEWLETAATGKLVAMGGGILGDIAPGFLKEIESISAAIADKQGQKQFGHTKEPGFMDALLIRQSFSALDKNEKDAMRQIADATPAMQLPRAVKDPSALSTKEASNLMINMVRLYKQLQKKDQLVAPTEKKVAVVEAQIIASLEDKLMIIYMQARDEPGDAPSESKPESKPAPISSSSHSSAGASSADKQLPRTQKAAPATGSKKP